MIFYKKIKFLSCYCLFILIAFTCSTVKAQLEELNEAVNESMNETISQVKNIDLGEANGDLAKGIDVAMEKMGEGMEFALKALENGDSATALATMEMMESTMDMAIGNIPQEEFMDFSNIKFDDFSPEELAAAQSMMGDMVTQNMEEMTEMMDHMEQVEGAGFDMISFMGTMDNAGFGLETMFSENIGSMESMFGEDMNMVDMMGDMEMSSEMMNVFSEGSEGMEMGDMMGMMSEMGEMSEMMSESMNFENFADMANMMDGDQMDMMTEGMMDMMEGGSFDHISVNMSKMGDMIKGESPGSMEGEAEKPDFFSTGEKDNQMMDAMSAEMEHMGESFEGMSDVEMGAFMEGMGEDSTMMDMGDMAGMGMDMGDMAGMAEDMGMDMGDMGMDMGDMGMDMGGDMFAGGEMMGGEMMGEMMGGEMMEHMKESFGDGENEGMFDEKGFGGEGDPPKHEPPPE